MTKAELIKELEQYPDDIKLTFQTANNMFVYDDVVVKKFEVPNNILKTLDVKNTYGYTLLITSSSFN